MLKTGSAPCEETPMFGAFPLSSASLEPVREPQGKPMESGVAAFGGCGWCFLPDDGLEWVLSLWTYFVHLWLLSHFASALKEQVPADRTGYP